LRVKPSDASVKLVVRYFFGKKLSVLKYSMLGMP